MTELLIGCGCALVCVATCVLLARSCVKGGSRLWVAAMALPLAQLLAALLVLYCVQAGGLSVLHGLGVLAALALCGVGDCALVRTGIHLQGRRLREQELQAAESNREAARAYAELLEGNTEKMAQACQGFAEQLEALQEGMRAGEEPLFGELECSLDAMEEQTRTSYTANKTANAVILLKAALCGERGVAFAFEGEVPAALEIDEAQLCSVFSNLLDNAIEGAAGVAEGARWVRASAGARGAYLVIEVVNSCAPGALKHTFGAGRRPGSALREHGWGLQIVDELAKRHDGSFSLKQSAPEEVTAVVVLKCVPRQGSPA
ncbi:MAG: sensor histidine kinase [Coriobacteriales bacterium]